MTGQLETYEEEEGIMSIVISFFFSYEIKVINLVGKSQTLEGDAY
jgi:hypothetical protein